MTPNELKSLRAELGLTQEQMAERIGVTVFAYRKWEQGQRKLRGAALKTVEGMRRSGPTKFAITEVI